MKTVKVSGRVAKLTWDQTVGGVQKRVASYTGNAVVLAHVYSIATDWVTVRFHRYAPNPGSADAVDCGAQCTVGPTRRLLPCRKSVASSRRCPLKRWKNPRGWRGGVNQKVAKSVWLARRMEKCRGISTRGPLDSSGKGFALGLRHFSSKTVFQAVLDGGPKKPSGCQETERPSGGGPGVDLLGPR